MPKFTFEVSNDTFTFMRSSTNFTFDLTKVNNDVARELFLHGIVQKVGDAAAGKSGIEADSAMAKVADALYAGEWSSRGAGEPDWVQHARAILREKVKAKAGKEWTTFKAIKEQDRRNEYLDKIFNRQSDDVKAAIEKAANKRLKELEAAKAKAKAMAGEVEINL